MRRFAIAAMLACLPCVAAHGADTGTGTNAPGAPDVSDSWALSGDLGAAALSVQGSAPGRRVRTRAIPYAYADFGRLFAREDTFGAKLLPLGWGALEVVARVSTEGADSAGPHVASRRSPRPVGVGTFQETPWGGVFVDAFDDTVSGGTLLEASYAAEVAFGPVTFYPQVGVARRSARYVDHLYGVSATEAAAPGTRPYAPGASTMPVLGVSAEWLLAPHWVVVAHVERESFDAAIADSPRVNRDGQSAAFVALARRF